MWKHVASSGLTLLIVVLLALAGVIGWGVDTYRSAGPLDQAICLRVEPGAAMRDVSEDLESQHAVASGRIFRMGAQYTDKASALKAGSFLVPERSSMQEIVHIITRGGQSTCGTEVVYRIGVNDKELEIRELDPSTSTFRITEEFDPTISELPGKYTEALEKSDTRFRVALAEGVTAWQVVDALRAVDFLAGSIDAVPEEGRLAPDSYEVSAGTARGDLVARMEARQKSRLAEAWEDRADDLPFDTPEDALVMASIVEKETGVAEEREQVASVFVNRLEQGMKLQTDPTVIYGITNGKGTLGRGLRQSELQADTPYNTYLIDGLPPTPIANPGLDALRAATRPAETEYLYFVADGSGGHAFATTLSEHNANVARWRAIEADRTGE